MAFGGMGAAVEIAGGLGRAGGHSEAIMADAEPRAVGANRAL